MSQPFFPSLPVTEHHLSKAPAAVVIAYADKVGEFPFAAAAINCAKLPFFPTAAQKSELFYAISCYLPCEARVPVHTLHGLSTEIMPAACYFFPYRIVLLQRLGL